LYVEKMTGADGLIQLRKNSATLIRNEGPAIF
jgi:hypothetical protein